MVAPFDDADILNEHRVIRRIDPANHIAWDDNRKCQRISSKAYKASSGVNGGMSVDHEEGIRGAGLDPNVYVTTPKYTGSVVFLVRDVRRFGLWVGSEPVEGNDHHCEVWPRPPATKFTGTQERDLRLAAAWFVQISGVELV